MCFKDSWEVCFRSGILGRMNHPEHLHQHIRKRIHRKMEPYPHPRRAVRVLDAVVAGVSVIFPASVIPQITEIWVFHRVEGVSLLTWMMFFVFNTTLLVYAIVHKEVRLIIMWSLFSLGYLLVVAGIVAYS